MELSIPCETVARLSKVLRVMKYDANIWFQSIRIENGIAIASNRAVLACEQIGGGGGPFHLAIDEALVKQCEKEGPFRSNLRITVAPAIPWASAKTDFGYIHPTNAGIWSSEPNAFDNWRAFAIPGYQAEKPRGAMYWDTDTLIDLAQSSPSGRLIFPEIIDTSQPTVIRDVHDDRWFGVFLSVNESAQYPGAVVPEWALA